MRRKNAVKKVDELLSLCGTQPGQKLVLHRVGVFLKHGEVGASTLGDGDDIAAAITRIGTSLDLIGRLEARHDAVDVVAI